MKDTAFSKEVQESTWMLQFLLTILTRKGKTAKKVSYKEILLLSISYLRKKLTSWKYLCDALNFQAEPAGSSNYICKSQYDHIPAWCIILSRLNQLSFSSYNNNNNLPGSERIRIRDGAFLTCFRIRDTKISGSWIPNPYFWEIREKCLGQDT